jgi:hypothetical protein
VHRGIGASVHLRCTPRPGMRFGPNGKLRILALDASKSIVSLHNEKAPRYLLILAIMTTLSATGRAQTEHNATPDVAVDQPSPAVKIVQGPVVELITDSTAQIAWSTNVNAGTLLHYGTDPQKLDQTASMPWGGLTHRVVLKNLRASTTYYFVAESAQGQDTGTRAEAPRASFTTGVPGEPPRANKQ